MEYIEGGSLEIFMEYIKGGSLEIFKEYIEGGSLQVLKEYIERGSLEIFKKYTKMRNTQRYSRSIKDFYVWRSLSILFHTPRFYWFYTLYDRLQLQVQPRNL